MNFPAGKAKVYAVKNAEGSWDWWLYFKTSHPCAYPEYHMNQRCTWTGAMAAAELFVRAESL